MSFEGKEGYPFFKYSFCKWFQACNTLEFCYHSKEKTMMCVSWDFPWFPKDKERPSFQPWEYATQWLRLQVKNTSRPLYRPRHRFLGITDTQVYRILLTEELGVSRTVNIAVTTISWEFGASVSSATAAISLNYLTVLPHLASGFPVIFLSRVAPDHSF